ncbi:MAG: hypothetical protein R3B45_06915 [Bdellovibrionota bacterium]
MPKTTIAVKKSVNVDQTSQLSRKVSNLFGYSTLLITLLLLLFFLVLPVGVIVTKAFFNGENFTLEYFTLLFSNSLQMESIWNSIYIGLVTTIITTLLSLPLAIINSRFEFRGKIAFSGLLLVPMVMPPFVGAIGIQRFFAKHGSVNLFLMEHGILDKPIEWISSQNMFWAVVFLEVLHLYPIMYLNLTAALANVIS